MAVFPGQRWCPRCKKFTNCKQHEAGAFQATECLACLNVFTSDYERRALFHHLWGLNINCCYECASAYQKDVWARLAELIDHPNG